ncbi:MAG: hemerythrin-like metal-binding protein [Gammaproteobacteria bacterium]|nr:hemerythrin-like metal-binding protein [Gammaproteobacteria bacterium]
MRYLEWKDEYRSGIESVDYEHRLLIDTINAACENLRRTLSRDAVFDCLGQLYQRVRGHFALEEKFMRKWGYRLYSLHKAEHEKLLERIRGMLDSFRNGACNGGDLSLDERLLTWFQQYFQTDGGSLKTS